MIPDKIKYGIIILAAGNSSRLGEPKQLLLFQNKSLIRHVTEAAIEAIASPVIIVTGSLEKPIIDEVNHLPVHLVHNNGWQEGMASSIRTGVRKLLNIADWPNGIILAVSDQPYVTSKLFLDLIEKAENGSSIVASSYENTVGTPVFFHAEYFDFLLTLKGADGAKKLLKRFEHQVSTVPFEQGGIDIDTQEDYRNLPGH